MRLIINLTPGGLKYTLKLRRKEKSNWRTPPNCVVNQRNGTIILSLKSGPICNPDYGMALTSGDRIKAVDCAIGENDERGICLAIKYLPPLL